MGQTYNPGFLNLVAGDYRLAATSDPINQATRLAGTELAYPVDQEYSAALHSTARPVVGAAFDLGAFEYGTYPPLRNPGQQSSLIGDQVQLSLVAIGADSFSASGLPAGLSINNTGQIRGTIDLLGEGTYTVIITASESGASSLASFTWIVATPPNKPPTNIALSSTIVADRTLAAMLGTVTVTDPNAGDTHTLAVSDGRFEIIAGQLRLKANVSLDRTAEPTVAIDITATDNGGLSRTQTFVISVIAPSVIDDGDLGYVETGTGWYSLGWWTSGYQTDSRFVSPGDGRKTATWQQAVVPGSYTVQASWFGYHNNVSNAPYRIYDGNRLLAEVRVDQKQTPSYSLGAPAAFLTLATVDIVSGNLRVVLGNDASGGTMVVADAVRIVPGLLVSPPSVVAGPGVVDDGEAGYTESAYGWYSFAWWTKGYQSDSRFANAGDGRNTATWEQTLAPGSYTIQASWFGYHNNVTNAPYRIYDGDRLLAEVRVDQQKTPAAVTGDPIPFRTLATLNIASGTLRVVLGNDASGGTLVVADAVRVLPIPLASASVVVAAAPLVNAAQTSNLVSVANNLVVSAAQAGGQGLGGVELASAAKPVTSGELPMTTNGLAWMPPAELENLQKLLEKWGETPDILDDLGGSY